MRLRRDGRGLTTPSKIVLWVLAAHCTLLFCLMISHLFSPKEKHCRPLMVRSVLPVVRVDSPQKAEIKTPSKQSQASLPKKQGKSPPTKKPISQDLLLEIEESFANVLSASTEPKKMKDLKIPVVVQASIDVEKVTDLSYGKCLVELLEKQLKLPEIGQVKVKITLNQSGRITAVEILEAKSEKNAHCLKNQLPLLELPCFNDFGISTPVLEFITLFRNVENQ